MRTALACAGLALGLAACTPHRPPPQRLALECPPKQGLLLRTAIAADGRSCDYRTSAGDEVSLQLVPVTSSVAAALAPIERKLMDQARPAAAGASTIDGHSGVNVSAAAAVRSASEVRLREDLFSPAKRGYLASFVLARDDLPSGLKAIGYEAAGPRTGPLAVAVIKSRGEDQDRLHRDAVALARLNGGV